MECGQREGIHHSGNWAACLQHSTDSEPPDTALLGEVYRAQTLGQAQPSGMGHLGLPAVCRVPTVHPPCSNLGSTVCAIPRPQHKLERSGILRGGRIPSPPKCIWTPPKAQLLTLTNPTITSSAPDRETEAQSCCVTLPSEGSNHTAGQGLSFRCPGGPWSHSVLKA